ncbi:MAG: hypothetical protein M3354_07825, partial [Chloroflexota bacterium]|nr:hypothetical protein [Chloroflexota bacterium]
FMADAAVIAAVQKQQAYVQREVLAVTIETDPDLSVESCEVNSALEHVFPSVKVGDYRATIALAPTSSR